MQVERVSNRPYLRSSPIPLIEVKVAEGQVVLDCMVVFPQESSRGEVMVDHAAYLIFSDGMMSPLPNRVEA